jgi:type VI secretion system secreted protein VgrG
MSTARPITLECDHPPIAALDVALLVVEERISDVYRIVVDGLTSNQATDCWLGVGRSAKVTCETGPGATRTFHGVVSEVTRMGFVAYSARVWFRIVIVPPVALLALTRRSRCFITTASGATSRKTRDVLALILAKSVDAPATTASYSLDDGAPDLGSALQFDETDLDFLRRTCEAAGIGWYFDAVGDGAKICFVDAFSKYPRLPQSPDAQDLRGVRETRRLVPKRTTMHAWDADSPATNLDGVATSTLAEAKGSIELYEAGYTAAAVGNALAAVRLQQATTPGRTLHGRGVASAFRPGYVFEYRPANLSQMPGVGGVHLLTGVTHVGWQSCPGSAEILEAYAADPANSSIVMPQQMQGYGNAFTAVHQDSGYRPARTTPVPQPGGLLRATLCDNTGATGTATTAAPYMDRQGRYQVLLPFPDADGKPGCLLAPVRPLTGFGGSAEVWQMPLRIGTTVYLLFENGSIDRPVIAGVQANRDQPTSIPNTVQPATLQSTYVQSILKTSSGIVVKVTDGSSIVLAPSPAKP